MIDDIATPAAAPRFSWRNLIAGPSRPSQRPSDRAIADAIDSVVDLFAGGSASYWQLQTADARITITRETAQ